MTNMKTEYYAETRGGQKAYFSRVPPGHEVFNGYGRPPFTLLGFLGKDEPEMWTAHGQWLDDGTEHPNDLMLKK